MQDLNAPEGDDHVAILMATYNGARFLNEQLASILRQKHSAWTLFISDDGSSDKTLEIAAEMCCRGDGRRAEVFSGPQRGFSSNFLSLVCRPEIQANFYAWSDQDDIWCEDKLEVAVAWLRTIPSDTPALYCGRTEMIGESGLYVGRSTLFTRPPSFANALVQSIAGGNTMVFNNAARALLQEAGDNLVVVSHDWWAYQLVSGAGGLVQYDPEPKVLYRQHDRNLVGANSSLGARVARMQMVFQGRFREWNERTVNALSSMQHRLTDESRSTLGHFKAARNQPLHERILGCLRAGVFRQTLLGNLGLMLAIIFRKI